MSQKYLRQVRATFSGGGGGVAVTELKIEFDVAKTISGVPNEGVVRVWNLNARNRQALGKEFDKVRLEAGYQGTGMGIILQGAIREVFHRRDQVDIISEVSVGDGDLADRTGVVARTWPAGTEVKQIIQDIYNDGMPGISQGEMRGLENLPRTRRPVTIVGSSRRAMDQIARTHNLFWSYQNETLEIIPADGNLNQRTLISPRTGMIGVPTITDNGIVVQTLLDASIRPNRLIEVQSETLDMNDAGSTYRVNSVGFRGDNRDGPFMAEVEGANIMNGKVTG